MRLSWFAWCLPASSPLRAWVSSLTARYGQSDYGSSSLFAVISITPRGLNSLIEVQLSWRRRWRLVSSSYVHFARREEFCTAMIFMIFGSWFEFRAREPMFLNPISNIKFATSSIGWLRYTRTTIQGVGLFWSLSTQILVDVLRPLAVSVSASVFRKALSGMILRALICIWETHKLLCRFGNRFLVEREIGFDGIQRAVSQISLASCIRWPKLTKSGPTKSSRASSETHSGAIINRICISRIGI